MRAAKLLDGLVRTPGQLQGDVVAAPLVALSLLGVKRDACSTNDET